MFRNYFITAFRNILGNKIQSLIQVLSLTIGITAAILIGAYARYELSYDRFNENFDRIYRVEFNDAVGQHTAIGHRIKQNFPEVGNVVRLVNWDGKDFSMLVFIPSEDPSDKGRMVRIEDYFYCDSTIFDVFSFEFIQGDPEMALKDPYSVVLTESTARKFFGDKDPVGEEIGQWGEINGGSTVTAVIKDVKNSHIEINMLVSITSIEVVEYEGGEGSRGDPDYMNEYHSGSSYMTYILLPEHMDPSYIEKRINDYFNEDWKVNRPQNWGKGFTLRPLEDVYFSTGLTNEGNNFRHGNMKQLYVLVTIAVFILIIAIINYINLTTARASLRAKEVGIRKVAGSSKSGLVSQFLVESIIVALFSFLVAITLVQLLLPEFNRLAAGELEMNDVSTPATWIIYLISVIIIGIISGIYPSFYMTGFQPLKSYSGKHRRGMGKVIIRQSLLIFQFIISVVLIIGVSVVLRQLHYMKTADLGFNKELIINQLLSNWVIKDFSKVQYVREQLLKNPNIKGVAHSGPLLGTEQAFITGGWEINGIKTSSTYLGIDPDYFDVMGIKMVDGRNLSWDRPGDNPYLHDPKSWKIIVNETFVREYELESPVGYSFIDYDGAAIEIIGVVQDFHFRSLKEKIEPTFFFWYRGLNYLNIKITPNDIPGTIKYIEKVCLYAEGAPEDADLFFQSSFLDETFDRQYRKDEQTAKIIANFAIVAILIACLGLFGLSSFMAVRRTKEIGIHKAMGASVQTVFLMLSREFIKWIILSVVIACPVAWYIMHKWLQSFAYRTNISWWIFVLAILVAFAIAFATVTWQSLKTARTNPVEALRYE